MWPRRLRNPARWRGHVGSSQSHGSGLQNKRTLGFTLICTFLPPVLSGAVKFMMNVIIQAERLRDAHLLLTFPTFWFMTSPALTEKCRAQVQQDSGSMKLIKVHNHTIRFITAEQLSLWTLSPQLLTISARLLCASVTGRQLTALPGPLTILTTRTWIPKSTVSTELHNHPE